MLRRILQLVIIGLAVFTAVRLWRGLKARRIPEVPDDWRELATRAPVLTDALDLRDRLHQVIAGDDRRVQRALLLDVHDILAEVVELVRVRESVEDHIRAVRQGPAGRRSGRPLPAEQERQRKETLAALEARADRFANEAAQGVAGLRQVYLELLETREAGRGGGAEAARKTRALVDSLRAQAEAEREIHRFLNDRDSEG